MLDIVCSFLGLVVLSPLLIPVMALVWLQDFHSPLYVATRLGKDSRPFQIVKLRSMVVNADKIGIDSTSSNDPRITSIGYFIRRFKLDEFTQLWNVLKGDMSLVGPRPPIPSEVSRYKDWQLKRINAVPGMISPYVVQGRSDLSFEEWVRSDLDYVENWSLWLDTKILFQAIPAVLKGKGAY